MSNGKTFEVTFDGRTVVDTRELLKQAKVKDALRRIATSTSKVGASLGTKKTRGAGPQKSDAV